MTARSLRSLAAAAGGLALLLSAGAASAATCVGSCGTLGANGDVTAAPGGGTYGWISTDGGVDGVGQLPGITGSTNGSTFTTSTFHATSGENLQYAFNFISSDGQYAADQFIYEDYASVRLVDAGTGDTVAMLFNARTEPSGNIVPGSGLPAISPGVVLTPATVAMTPGSGINGAPFWSPLGGDSGQCWGPGCGLTGWIHSDYTVDATGDYKLVFAVSNFGDTAYQSGMAYAGLKIGEVEIEDSVPEPAAWALLMAGFGGLGLALRRRRASARLEAAPAV